MPTPGTLIANNESYFIIAENNEKYICHEYYDGIEKIVPIYTLVSKLSEEEKKKYCNLINKIRERIEKTVEEEKEHELINAKSDYERREIKKNARTEKYHKEGIKCLSEEMKDELINMFDRLKQEDILILHNGCLETCLDDKGVKFMNGKEKKNWIGEALSKIDELSIEEIKELEIYKVLYG